MMVAIRYGPFTNLTRLYSHQIGPNSQSGVKMKTLAEIHPSVASSLWRALGSGNLPLVLFPVYAH